MHPRSTHLARPSTGPEALALILSLTAVAAAIAAMLLMTVI